MFHYEKHDSFKIDEERQWDYEKLLNIYRAPDVKHDFILNCNVLQCIPQISKQVKFLLTFRFSFIPVLLGDYKVELVLFID